MKLNKMYVAKGTFNKLVAIAENWNTGQRWLNWEFTQTLLDETSYSMEECQFLAGGVDHIDFTSRSITVHDRCLSTGHDVRNRPGVPEIIDGTTKIILRNIKTSRS